MLKEDKCHFCNRLATTEKRIVVDIEASHDLDDDGREIWFSHPVYETVFVCEEHAEEDKDERIGEEWN